MRKYVQLLIAGSAATLMLAILTASAAANRLSVSNQNFRAVWSPMTIRSPISAIIECNVTVEGSLHSRTISKVVGSLIGYITRAIARHPCAGFANFYTLNGVEVVLGVTTQNLLPWHVRYAGFTGTLPNMTGVTVDIVGAGIAAVSAGCLALYRSTPENPIRALLLIGAGGVITGIRLDETVRLLEAVGNCTDYVFLAGTGTFTLLGNTTPITVRLI